MDTRDTPRPIELLRPLPAVVAAGPVPRVAAPAPRPPGAALSLRVVGRGLARYWWQVLLLWVVGTAGLSAFVYKKLRPTYEAGSLLRVDLAPQSPFGDTGRAATEEVQLETQVQLITSVNVLRAAAADPRVAGAAMVRGAADPADVLGALLEVKLKPRSYLIRVSLTSTSSEEAAAVVNAVVDAYLKADGAWAEGLNQDRIRRMEEFRDELRAQAEGKKEALLELAARGNVDATALGREQGDGRGARATRPSVTIEEYRKLRGDLIRAKMDLSEAEAQLQALRDARGPRAAADDPLGDDPDLADLRDRIEAARGRKAAADRLIRRGLDPAATRARDHLADLVEQSASLRARKLEALGRAAGDPGRAADPALAQAQGRVAALKASRRNLEATLEQLDVANREQATDAVKMGLVRADLEQIQGMLDEVNKKAEALRFAARGASRTVRIDEARPAAAAAADKRPRMLAMIPAATLLMLVAAATLLEVRAGRVGCPDLLSQRIRAEVFTVPAVPALPAPGARPRRGAPPAQEFVNRVDHLRVALCEAAAPGRGRSTLITSAVGGEGKTTLAAQLAARCADAGLCTLLIDADLRRATLGEVLGVPDSPGLSDVLGGLATLEAALVDPPGMHGCWFLPAGTPESNPGRVLQGHRIRALFEELHRRFDAIIIDAPPVLPVPDALALGRWVDGVILAARHDASRLPPLQEAQKMLASAGIPLFGVVVNGARRAATARDGHAYAYPSRRAAGSAE